MNIEHPFKKEGRGKMFLDSRVFCTKRSLFNFGECFPDFVRLWFFKKEKMEGFSVFTLFWLALPHFTKPGQLAPPNSRIPKIGKKKSEFFSFCFFFIFFGKKGKEEWGYRGGFIEKRSKICGGKWQILLLEYFLCQAVEHTVFYPWRIFSLNSLFC